MHFDAELLSGRDLYRRVIQDGVLRARRSVWIATANLKELLVEEGPPRRGYTSIVRIFRRLADADVELRILYATTPSRPFRAALERDKVLQKGGLKLKQCARLHMKTVIVDGSGLYLGSANFTGAGLGAKGEQRRNFELGFWSEDFHLLDQVQTLYQSLWDGAPCDNCAVKNLCPDPGPYRIRSAARASRSSGRP